jgi:omega-6 fatty acid desaturase (delta-12 desaturase)
VRVEADPLHRLAQARNAAVPRSDTLLNSQDDKKERTEVFELIEKYSKAHWGRAWLEVFHTLAFHALCWMHQDSWIATIFASLLRVRIFILFHDMAHDAFFPSHTMNNIMGVLMGCMNHTPMSFWQRGHNHHHRHSNNLKYPQLSQSNPWTLEQYNMAAPWKRRVYKATFAPFGFLLVAPTLLFGFAFRFMARWYEHLGDAVYFFFVWYTGSWAFEAWTFVLAGIPAFTLFHVQHTFPDAKRYTPDQWSFYENGMAGSSFLHVPWFFKYFTANIEFHHIHHLSPLVPLYRLPECHRAGGKLFDRVPRVTFGDALRWMTPLVWDTANEKFVEV